MGEKTSIEWTRGDDGTPGSTWNPTLGCTKVGAGCDHCYAETFVNRFAGSKGFPERFDTIVLRDEVHLRKPLHWRRPRRVFVNSLSDLFHDDIPDAYIARVFAVMAAASQHTFQVLTKRHGRMRSLLRSMDFGRLVSQATADLKIGHLTPQSLWPLPNVWIGVSAENQAWANVRVPALLDIPAAVRFVSAEPLLGPIDFRAIEVPRVGAMDALLSGLDWVIVGGESGPGSRPMHPQWARQIEADCEATDVAFLFKQWGDWTPFVPDGADSDTADGWVRQTDGRVMAEDEALSDGGRFYGMWRLGKRRTGRSLYGGDETHDGYPTGRVFA